MAFVSSRSRERARRRRALIRRVAVFVAAMAALLALGYSSYQTGLLLAERKVVALRTELDDVTRERDAALAARDNLQSALNRANEQVAGLQTRYDADVPKGPMAELLQLLRQRLSDGIGSERIADALRAVRSVMPCEGRPTTRRFAIRPGQVPVSEDTVSFADGLITLFVTPTPEDPGRSLTATFTRPGGVAVSFSGPSPLRASLTVDNAELRFTIANSDLRGFVTATMQTCGR